MKRTQMLSLAAVVVLLVAPPLLAAEIDLSGTWTLNMEKGDKMERPERGRGEPGGARGRKSDGRSGMSDGRGGRGGRGGRAEDRGRGPGPGSMMSDVLILSQTDGALLFRQEDGRERTIYTNGEPQTTVGFRGEEVQVTATWVEGRLAIHRSADDGPGMTEIYEISEDGKTLTVTRTMSGRNGERNFTQVYDRTE